MHQQIKIIMLGDRASGKTCYILAMYEAMQFGTHGFAVTTVDPDQGVKLSNLWKTLVNESGNNRWPDKTNQISIYKFEFSEGLDSKLEFEWVDYRGGAMSEESSERDVQELKKQVLQSSGVFLCISGEHLKEKITDGNKFKISVDTKAKFMIKYLVDFGKEISREERQFSPIIITISQYDLCHKRAKEELIEDIKKIFPPLFIENAYWNVMICPVSLGKELAENPDYGRISPKNVDLPVMFALYCKIGQLRKSQDQEYQKNLAILDDFEESNSFIRWMRRIGSHKIRNIKKELKKNEDEIAISKNLMKRIVEELTNREATTYFNGQESDWNWF
jgi:GTPase SAR1 family protein